MILHKVNAHWLHELPHGPGLCLLLPGALLLRPEDADLGPEWSKTAPRFIICTGCDPYLERLLNERGVAVLRPRDPVDAIAQGAEVELDPAAGTLTEISSGRRFALVALKPAHLAAMARHG